MPISEDVRTLLEFSIELLVVGGGLPSLFLQRPAWLRELRNRYSVWSAVRLARHVNSLAVIPPLLGLIIFWHLGLAAGWSWATFGLNESMLKGLFYLSLSLGLMAVGWLWYQVRMTSFLQVTQRIFWLIWYVHKRPQHRMPSANRLQSMWGRDSLVHQRHHQGSSPAADTFLLAVPSVPGGWARFVAWLFTRIWFRPQNEWLGNALQDLGRLGANTRTPQETIFVLQALHDLARIVPMDTTAARAPLARLCEATTQSLWPIDASNTEAFAKAIGVFRELLQRWRQTPIISEPSHEEQARNIPPPEGTRSESPILPHLYRLGQAVLDHQEMLLRSDYLALFKASLNEDRLGESHGEARVLFLLGVQALRRGQWEAVLYIAEKLREYSLCDLRQNLSPGSIRRVDLAKAEDEALLDWSERCEATAWYLGLVSIIIYKAPGAWPWIIRYLKKDFGLQEDTLSDTILCIALKYSVQFFTRLTLEPETAQAVACLRERLHMCAPHTAAEPLPCDALGGGTATPPPAQGPQGAS